MNVVGVDLSMTSTGLAHAVNGSLTANRRVQSKGSKGDTLLSRHLRLQQISDNVLGWVADLAPSLVVVEAPSFGSQTGSQHDRSGLWWLVVAALHDAGFPVAQVPPNTRATYATGKGNAGKDAVLASVLRRYEQPGSPFYLIDGNDVADATVLAAMGSRWAGVPIEDSLPQTHLRAMDGAEWPETL